MQSPFLDANLRHPIELPDGSNYINTVWLRSVIDHPRIEVGEFSYYNDFEPVDDYAARIAPYLHGFSPERLVIGKFCQFAHGTRFITSSANHPKRWFTAYPFSVFNHEVGNFFLEEFSQGEDTNVGHDVWIGHNAMIMPGVTLGNGVIVGSGAVVAHDVPPFAVVAGNPARIVRMRFSQEVIDLLEELAWWHMDPEEIREILPVLTSADIPALEQLVVARK